MHHAPHAARDASPRRRSAPVALLIAVLVGATACGSGGSASKSGQAEPTTPPPVTAPSASTSGDSDTVATTSVAPSSDPATTLAVDKSGAQPPGTVHLTLATNETRDRPGGLIVTDFVDTVAEMSGGRIEIEAEFEYPSGDLTAYDQRVIDAMLAGDFDLSLARAGAWESAGVREMAALQLPGTFRNDAQVDAVTTADVAGDILAGLDAVGATGLGLYPENLRHLAMYAEGPLALDDLQGAALRVPLQPTVFEWMSAIGAEPLDLAFPDYEAQAASGELAGSDVSLAVRSIVPNGSSTAVMTANAPLYAKFSVLAISDAALESLDPATVEVLRDASAAVLATTIESRPREEELAQGACDEGMAIAASPTDVVDEIVAAAAPVIDAAEADPVVGPILEAVRSAAGSGRTVEVATCVAQMVPDAAELVADAGDLPNGVYRLEVTRAELEAAGLPASACDENCGTYTFTLADGQYSWEVDWEQYPPADLPVGGCCWLEQSGIYQVVGNMAYIQMQWLYDADSEFVLAVSWRVDPDGDLTFEYVDGDAKWKRWMLATVTIPRWVRVGDA